MELVNQCGFSAYPDEILLEGCVYNETEEDQQTEDMLECVMEASCNEFDIMECEHQHGAESERTDESPEVEPLKILFTQTELILHLTVHQQLMNKGVTILTFLLPVLQTMN